MLNGDNIDITRFAFLQTNPADGGRYINSDSHFMVDPESTVRGLARLIARTEGKDWPVIAQEPLRLKPVPGLSGQFRNASAVATSSEKSALSTTA